MYLKVNVRCLFERNNSKYSKYTAKDTTKNTTLKISTNNYKLNELVTLQAPFMALKLVFVFLSESLC